MATAVLVQHVTWPGVLAVDSCEYVCSHGITPGRATLSTFPQVAAPKEFGNLSFTDGIRTFTLRDCKVDIVSSSKTSGGDIYTLEIVDRRWRWGFGGVSGNYNQKDDNGKLVPWSIRSPQELAAICLKEMGERGAIVRLPPGLPKQAGANLDRYLKLGQNFPQTLTNPEQIWDHTNPAQALARLCELWGCRVIYQPVRDRVLICPLGKGAKFPNLPCEMIAANLEQVAAPKYVACFSTEPIKYQMRWKLEAVGREWDGAILPIDELSYSPVNTFGVQISQVVAWATSTGLGLGVKLEYKDPTTGAVNGATHLVSAGAGTTAQKYTNLMNQFNADPRINPFFNVTIPDAVTLRFTAKKANLRFTLSVFDPEGNATWALVKHVQAGGNANKNTWANCPPPFMNVQATDRLSVAEAQGLAADHVFRSYRIINLDLHDKFPGAGKGRPIELPIVGKIKRRQQFVLQDSKVDQVVPAPRIPGAANKANPAGAVLLPGVIPGGGVLPEFYNGYSRSQAATVTGSVWRNLRGTSVNFWFDDLNLSENTKATDRVFISFSVDAKEQMITFSSPVYKYQPGAEGITYCEVPDLTLETGAFVLSSETNQFVKWEEFLRILNGTGPTEWFPREDMKVGIALRYDEDGKVTKTDYDGVQDAKQRAGYYMRGVGTKYQIKGGEIRQYIGIVPHDPDGYAQQMSVKIGGGGPTTILSGNTEFHPSVATYPARRRPENLPPDKSAALANLAERQWYEDNKADKK